MPFILSLAAGFSLGATDLDRLIHPLTKLLRFRQKTRRNLAVGLRTVGDPAAHALALVPNFGLLIHLKVEAVIVGNAKHHPIKVQAGPTKHLFGGDRSCRP